MLKSQNATMQLQLDKHSMEKKNSMEDLQNEVSNISLNILSNQYIKSSAFSLQNSRLKSALAVSKGALKSATMEVNKIGDLVTLSLSKLLF